MKIRNGFVSNSSSSSFIIELSRLNELQIKDIKNHIEIGKRIDSKLDEPRFVWYDKWDITIDEFALKADTIMDNFDLPYLCTNYLGVSEDDITYFNSWDSDEKYQQYKKLAQRVDKINKLSNDLDN